MLANRPVMGRSRGPEGIHPLDPIILEHEDKVSFAIIMAINSALLHTTALYFQFSV